MAAQVSTPTLYLFIYKFIGSSGLGLWPKLQEEEQENTDRATRDVRSRHTGAEGQVQNRCRTG